MANEIKGLLYGIFLYLNINTEPVTILSALMIIDTILGCIKILRIDYTKFKTRELIVGFVSKIALLILPLSVALIGKGIGYDLRLLVELSLKILIISEGISIITNLIAIKTKEEVADFDIITKFLKKIRDFLIHIGNSLFKFNKDK